MGILLLAEVTTKHIAERGNRLIDGNIQAQSNPATAATSGDGEAPAVSSSSAERKSAAPVAADREYNIDDPAFVKKLIALHDEYSDVIIKYFQSNNLLQNALKDAFVSFMNREMVGS